MKQNPSSPPEQKSQKVTKLSPFSKAWSLICPCFIGTPTQQYWKNNQNKKSESDKFSINETPSFLFVKTSEKDSELTVQALTLNSRIKSTYPERQFKSLHQLTQKFELEENIYVSAVKKWQFYPISPFFENQFIVLGNPTARMLAYIVNKKINPSSKLLSKINKTQTNERPLSFYSRTNLDKYWGKRYAFFQKFDEGIRMNQQSWPCTIPEPVSDHIASNIKCQVVINAFCGVGGEAIKLANTCGKVIATDPYENNLKNMENNCKVYGVQNVQAHLQEVNWVQGVKNNVILISLYAKLQEQCLISQTTPLSSLKPNMKVVISKAISMTKNIVIILPANIDINQLVQTFAQEIMKQGICSETCSIKIQKIFYSSQLKYLVVYYGPLVNNCVQINDELMWIYQFLDAHSKKYFQFRRIIKKIRQILGMVTLFNALIQSCSIPEGSIIQKLITFIRQNNLIEQQKIDKIVAEKSPKKAGDRTTKVQSDSQEHQQTISQFSIPSGANKIQFDIKDIECETSPFKSALMFRESARLSSTQFKSPKGLVFKSAIGKRTEQMSKSFKNEDGVQISHSP